jgi:hypothetical protein
MTATAANLCWKLELARNKNSPCKDQTIFPRLVKNETRRVRAGTTAHQRKTHTTYLFFNIRTDDRGNNTSIDYGDFV